MTKRVRIIDAARGLCVILMVVHHFLFDGVETLGWPEWLFSNPVFNLLHYVVAGAFIFMSGLSSRFSRSNVKRGLKTIAAALALTLVTKLIGSPIYFGVIHLLGACMLFYGLTGGLWERFTGPAFPIACALLTAASVLVLARLNPVEAKYLWALGLWSDRFESADYFPLLPWIFVFLAGTWAGKPVREKRLPAWFYEAKAPALEAVGKKAFIIYLLHQPVLYGIVWIIEKIC